MKKKIILPVVMLFTFSHCVFSQAPNWLWAKGIGSASFADAGYSTAIDASGNVYTTGQFISTVDFDPGPGVYNLASAQFSYPDIFILKLDASGNFVWAKRIGAFYSDGGYSITVDDSANVYVTGYFNGTVDFDPGPGIYNLTGNANDIFILKLDSSGDFIWARAIGCPFYYQFGFSIAVDNFGNVYTTGSFEGTVDFDPGTGVFNLTSNGSTDIFVSKLDASGNFLWAKAFGGPNPDKGCSIALDAFGNAYTTGYFKDTVDFDPGVGVFNLVGQSSTSNMFISKLDAFGNFVWAKSMDAPSGAPVSGNSIFINRNGNGDIYTTGWFFGTVDFDPGAGVFNLSSGHHEIFLSRLDSSGNFVWAKAMDGTNTSEGFSIALDVSGNVYSTGYFNGTTDFDPGAGTFNLTSGGNSEDIFVSKLDVNGNFIWAIQINGVQNSQDDADHGNSLITDNNGNVILTGYFRSYSLTFGSDIINNSSEGIADIFIAKLGASVITGNDNKENPPVEVLVSPNPATNEIAIQNSRGKIESVEVWDVVGQLQTSNLKLRTNSIDVSNLAPGIYFVSIRDNKNNLVTRKIIKM